MPIKIFRKKKKEKTLRLQIQICQVKFIFCLKYILSEAFEECSIILIMGPDSNHPLP